MRFKIVIPSYNGYPWIAKCLASLEAQSYPDFDVCVIDDASPDSRQKEIISEYCERNGWLAIFNEVNQKALANIVMGIERLECKDDDVIVLIDGDDWLLNEWALARVAEAYENSRALMTYGQFLVWRLQRTGQCRPMTWWEKRRCNFRKNEWIFSHLRTFKYGLWKKVKDEDLRGPDGKYFATAWDLAMMYPMLEMAGRKRIKFIPEILYVYNDDNPINDFKIYEKNQEETAQHIRAKPRYKRLSL